MAHSITVTTADLRLTTGMAAGTSVMTLDGAIPVEYLNIGDRVLTRDGARTLRGIAVRVVNGDAVRVGAGTLAHDKPVEDVVLAVGQPMLVRDWRAKALYGAAQALVPVERMADGQMIRRVSVRGLRMFTLTFDSVVVVYAGGLELACSATVDA
jgi:Hint domain